MPAMDGEETVQLNGSATRDRVDVDRFQVNGTATVREGVRAREVSVNGSLDVGGHLEAEDVDLDGGTSVAGDVRAERVETDGSATFGGDCSVDHLDADGSTTVEGNLDGHDIDSDGSTTIEGSLVANGAEFDGSTTVAGLADVTDLDVDGSGTFGDVTAETFEAEGVLDAAAVRSDRFELELGGDSRIERVASGEVLVTRRGLGSSLLGRLLNRGEPTLSVDTVEGERVELDATTAGTVAAETVVLGADAEVDVVYADELDADDAAVGDVRPYAEYAPDNQKGDAAEAAGNDIEVRDDADDEDGDVEPPE